MTVPLTRTEILRELKEVGLSISVSSFNILLQKNLFTIQKIYGGRYSASRKQAEYIKRIIWAYYYGNETYPDDEEVKD